MDNFEGLYKRLNTAQKDAVDTIEGPLLVIAGPGTGKTQLLSARVANILRRTDTLPQNILCLTFTESGAENMRERLTRFIGQTAYNVTIGTYHSFGSDIIGRYPQYFTATQLQNPVDELGKHQIIRDIVAGLGYRNPLKQLQHHLGDLMSTLSEVKRALLTADDLRAIAAENSSFIEGGTAHARPILDELGANSRITIKALPLFEQLHTVISSLVPESSVHAQFGSIAEMATAELAAALETAQETRKTTTLTAWKNTWLIKNEQNQFELGGALENERMIALADVFEQYQAALAKQGLYDFDDMIARAIEALEQHPDLRYTLQEQYLYILLDEFQDTNAAQLKLVQLLTDNPVNEGRPNVMAVGDDDQAIYAFQGAQYSNMLDFYRMYRGVKVINLTENYRSHADVLATSAGIAEQISARLHHQLEGMSKTLRAANTSMPKQARIARQELVSSEAHYDWIAQRINELVSSGTDPREIAVLAPKHKQLEPLVAHLNALDIAVRYEKRENILEAPVVKQLLTMSRLVLALHHNNMKLADALWPEVLSFDFWEIPTRNIWQLAWQVNDDREMNWTKLLLEEVSCKTPALLFCTLAHKTSTETCEAMLDYLIGTEEVSTNETDAPYVRSPLRSYYMSQAAKTDQPEIFYETVSHLKVLRAKLREHQAATAQTLSLADLIQFIEMYEAAGERMQSTSPYNQQARAVQLMTVFKSKGLEFEHVFLACCHDDVWGGSSRGSTNRLTLPPNLRPIRHAGATDDERLRILYVAITRAKLGLYMTSFTHNYSGKLNKRLKYLNEQEQADGSFKAMVLPESCQVVVVSQHVIPPLEILELNWRSRHLAAIGQSQLRGLLADRLQAYQLSPTHLNQFLDVIYSGPEAFFFSTLLRFPQAPSISGQYGNAIHETLEWYQNKINDSGAAPTADAAVTVFKERLKQKRLTEQQFFLESERGERTIRAYLQQRRAMFVPGAKVEQNFKREGVFIGPVHMDGKVDRIEVDREHKTITVVDYKTGSGYSRWLNDAKLHKYRQQLYCYKLLIEHSHTFAGYTVTEGRLEFVEPNNKGEVSPALILKFDETEQARVTALMTAVWERIQKLDFPDISGYSKDLKGMLSFEDNILGTEE